MKSIKQYFRQLNNKEIYLLKSLNTTDKVQAFINNNIIYDPYREDRSIKEVINDKKAECANGALFACACLIYNGFEAFLVELLPRGDEEHILCVYKKDSKYGSIAQSKFLGLRSRHPIYLTLRDLVASYIEFYFAFDGHYSLVSYTNLFSLDKYKFKWLTDGKCVVKIFKDIRETKHIKICDEKSRYNYVDEKRYWREVLFIPKEVKIPKRYMRKIPENFKLKINR